MAETLKVVHSLMNNVTIVMEGTQCLLLSYLYHSTESCLVDGKVSMGGILNTLGEFLLC